MKKLTVGSGDFERKYTNLLGMEVTFLSPYYEDRRYGGLSIKPHITVEQNKIFFDGILIEQLPLQFAECVARELIDEIDEKVITNFATELFMWGLHDSTFVPIRKPYTVNGEVVCGTIVEYYVKVKDLYKYGTPDISNWSWGNEAGGSFEALSPYEFRWYFECGGGHIAVYLIAE